MSGIAPLLEEIIKRMWLSVDSGNIKSPYTLPCLWNINFTRCSHSSTSRMQPREDVLVRSSGMYTASLMALWVKNLPGNAGDTGDDGSISGFRSPEIVSEQMAIHSSVLAWRIPWTEEPGGVTKSWTQLCDGAPLHAGMYMWLNSIRVSM